MSGLILIADEIPVDDAYALFDMARRGIITHLPIGNDFTVTDDNGRRVRYCGDYETRR